MRTLGLEGEIRFRKSGSLEDLVLLRVRGGFGGVAKTCVADVEDTCSIGSVILKTVE